MNPFDQAWALLKMPVYETDYPGIRFMTYGQDDEIVPDDGGFYGPYQKYGAAMKEDREGYGIEYMQPSEFLSLSGNPGGTIYRDKETGEPRTPRQIADNYGPDNKYYDMFNHYRALMDRAQAGEPLVFGMPYINLDKDGKHLLQDGRHRMAELLARGDKKVPVLVQREPVQRRIR